MHNNNDYKRGQAYEQEGGKREESEEGEKGVKVISYSCMKILEVKTFSSTPLVEKYCLCSSSLKKSWFNSTLAK